MQALFAVLCSVYVSRRHLEGGEEKLAGRKLQEAHSLGGDRRLEKHDEVLGKRKACEDGDAAGERSHEHTLAQLLKVVPNGHLKVLWELLLGWVQPVFNGAPLGWGKGGIALDCWHVHAGSSWWLRLACVWWWWASPSSPLRFDVLHLSVHVPWLPPWPSSCDLHRRKHGRVCSGRSVGRKASEEVNDRGSAHHPCTTMMVSTVLLCVLQT